MNYLDVINLSDFLQRVRIMLKEDEEIEWDVKSEIVLFYAMIGLKPVGVNKHFVMTAIHQRFCNLVQKDVSSQVIWDHLDSMYDMSALHESEIIPFPNDEVDFELGEEFDDLIEEKYGITIDRPKEEDDNKSQQNLSLNKAKQGTTPKSTFLTPQSVKAGKNSDSRSESRSSSVDSTGGRSKETPAKGNKSKRASSPLPTRSSRLDSSSSTPEPSEMPGSKKGSKSDSKTPASNTKKPATKPESQTPKTKSDTSDKRPKKEDILPPRKSRASTPQENSAKKRPDLTKKSDARAETPKPRSDRSSLDTPASAGLRKSSSKVDLSDKKKRLKAEETPKKGTPTPAKRRRN